MVNKGLEVREGRTELIAGGTTFIYPAKKGDYFSVAEQINNENNEGLILPITSQIVDLVYASFHSLGDDYSVEIRDMLNQGHTREVFWAFNGLFYLPKRDKYAGIIIEDRPDLDSLEQAIKGRDLKQRRDDLVKKLRVGDKGVRHVPYGFKDGEQSSRELAKNQLIIGLAGEEGAEKFAEISEFYKSKPYISSLGKVRKLTQTVLTLTTSTDDRGIGGEGLEIDAIDLGSRDDGYAFGVLK